MTCLFCDLVGFTASSEAADPEDVDRMLAAYSAMAQALIESHGGDGEANQAVKGGALRN